MLDRDHHLLGWRGLLDLDTGEPRQGAQCKRLRHLELLATVEVGAAEDDPEDQRAQRCLRGHAEYPGVASAFCLGPTKPEREVAHTGHRLPGDADQLGAHREVVRASRRDLHEHSGVRG